MAPAERGRLNVREFGAVGDGESDDTEALRSALSECAETGGTVFVPPGTYLTGPLEIGNNTTLRIESGATIQLVRDHEAFSSVHSRWEGWLQYGFQPCLSVADATNVRIEGGGRIDGAGDYWWAFHEAEELPEDIADRVSEMRARSERRDSGAALPFRPPLLEVVDSRSVTVEGVTLGNSPFWNTHLLFSEDVTISDARIENPADAPNGDGIDIDSSRFVRISDTYINAGDDAICLKSGKNEEGREIGAPCEAVTVTNCTIEAGHGGVVIGSEMSGDVRDVAVSNCVFRGTDRGIRLKTQRGRGGVVEDLRFDTILMRDVICPFVINGYYDIGIDSPPEPTDEGTPEVRNVTYQHITARDVASAGFLAGLPELRYGGIRFEDVDVTATKSFEADDPVPAMAWNAEPTHGFRGKSLGEVTFRDVRVRTRSGPAFEFAETDELRIEGLDLADDGDRPGVVLENVGTAVLSANSGRESDPSPMISASGSDTGTIALGAGLDDDDVQLDDLGRDVLRTR